MGVKQLFDDWLLDCKIVLYTEYMYDCSQKLALSNIIPTEVELIPAEKNLTKIRYVGRLWLPALLLLGCLGVGFFYSPWAYLGAGLLLVSILWLLWLIPRQVAYYRWGISADAIYVCYGRFFQKVEMMPLARVQYADHSSGPVQRYWGQSEITVTGAAAGAGSDITIAGVKEAEARQICAQIMSLSADKMAGI